jgi:quinolinate synthase
MHAAKHNIFRLFIFFCHLSKLQGVTCRIGETVILPDMRAGCSMADMADIQQTDKAWQELQELYKCTPQNTIYSASLFFSAT